MFTISIKLVLRLIWDIIYRSDPKIGSSADEHQGIEYCPCQEPFAGWCLPAKNF